MPSFRRWPGTRPANRKAGGSSHGAQEVQQAFAAAIAFGQQQHAVLGVAGALQAGQRAPRATGRSAAHIGEPVLPSFCIAPLIGARRDLIAERAQALARA